ncbi:MAG: AAA family ATPase [Muribaculaceae bacterium]|nr:AAA family ATPase [Muribaculaceae bacterium]
MVQFHPSMDYTDFVEGLRPVQNTIENNSSVNTFERKNGIFKDFCAEALKNFCDSQKSPSEIQSERNIEESYEKLREDIENGKVKEIPLRSEGVSMIPEVSTQGNILLKARDNNTGTYHTVSLNRIKKLSEIFKNINDLDKITNIYKEVSTVIGGCNSSAYWGLLMYLYKNYTQKLDANTEQVERKNYIFIIDEINRGEISKILGELFFSIDPGYRGEKGKVITQYHNLIEVGDDFEDGFFVPENVYIIGTMNDIDRSIESMDFAMRRRFAWKDISVESQMEILDNETSWGKNGKPDENTLKELKNRMTHLNQAIIDKYYKEPISNQVKIGLTKSFQIGPAYFLKFNLYNNFEDLWKYHIEGLLYEYLRGVPDIEIKMKSLLKAYNDKSDN